MLCIAYVHHVSRSPAGAAIVRLCTCAGGAKLTRDQALAAELRPGLLEGDVGRGHDHVGLLQAVLRDRLAVLANELDQLVERLAELLLVPGVAGRHGLVVELVEHLGVAFGELVLPLGGDPDDHDACPCSALSPEPEPEPEPEPAPSSPALCVDPAPSSAFILASSESTSLELDSWRSWRSMSSSPAPSWVRSSNVPA